MSVQLRCPICNYNIETVGHIILDCWWAQCFWKNLSINCSFLLFNFESIGDWLWYCVFNMTRDDMLLVIKGARTIWFKRNEVLHGGRQTNPILCARGLRFAHITEMNMERRFVVTDLNEGWQWKAPLEGFLKFNIDGAWDEVSKIAGLGICGRDHMGIILFALADWVSDVASSLRAEELSLQMAIRTADEIGYQKVVFEIDNAELMNLMMQGSHLIDSTHVNIDWCREKLMQHKDWKMSLVLRDANETADSLAKKAKKDKWRWFNREAIPYFLWKHYKDQHSTRAS